MDSGADISSTSTGGPDGTGATSNESAQPGWYAAQGDPPGTLRYWDGSQWLGGPVPGTEVDAQADKPVVNWAAGSALQTAARSGPTGSDPLATATFSTWGRRAAAWLIDVSIAVPFLIGAVVAFAAADAADGNSVNPESSLWIVGALLMLSILGVAFVNSVIVQGLTGRSLGKRVVGTKLIRGDTGEAAGIVRVLVRGFLAALLGNLTAGIYYLIDVTFPLWDDKRQRVSDKLVGTYVIDVRRTESL